MVKGLVDTLKNLRDSESSDVLSKAKDVAQKLDLEPVFSTKRKRKVKRLFDELAEDENQTLSDEQMLDKDCKMFLTAL
jgi:hypothetical protein